MQPVGIKINSEVRLPLAERRALFTKHANEAANKIAILVIAALIEKKQIQSFHEYIQMHVTAKGQEACSNLDLRSDVMVKNLIHDVIVHKIGKSAYQGALTVLTSFKEHGDETLAAKFLKEKTVPTARELINLLDAVDVSIVNEATASGLEPEVAINLAAMKVI